MPFANRDVFEVRQHRVVRGYKRHFRTFSFCCKADYRSVNLTSEAIFFFNEIVGEASSLKAYFEIWLYSHRMIYLRSQFLEISGFFRLRLESISGVPR